MPNAAKERAIGLIAGIGACMVWGADFVVPQIVHEFAPLEFTVARAVFFGLFSLLFCRRALASFKKFTAHDKLRVILLSAAGFWLYSLMLFWSINNGSAVITTVVMGTLPATIPLFSKKPTDHSRLFILGLGLILAGLVTLHAASLGHIKSPPLLAWALPFVCLSLWTWFGIRNAAFVKKHKDLSRTDIASLMGLANGLAMLIIGAFLLDIPHVIHHPAFGTFLLCAAAMGIANSWVGQWLWNICSLHCPPAIVGPILVMETVFGLLYTFAYQGRLPVMTETIAIVLFIAGALVTVRTETVKI